MRIALAQIDTHVGAIDANTDKVLRYAQRARDELGASVVLFPELALSGYPPEDLLLHGGMRRRVAEALARVSATVTGITVCVGYPEYQGEPPGESAGARIYNSAAVVRDGRVIANHRKRVLPNYAVFDEKRYFEPGTEVTAFEVDGRRFGLIVCEDVWSAEPARDCAAAGADAILVINGSPYHTAQQREREAVLGERARDTGLPLVYLNMVGGQDELVFDGGSFALNPDGELAFRAPVFEEGLHVVELTAANGGLRVKAAACAPTLPHAESVYRALVLGTRDYVNKNGFSGVVLGLSGGVDSALTLCIAVDALGADRVHAIAMPSRFTSRMSLDDASEQARRLGVRYDVLSIEPIFESTLAVLRDLFANHPPDVTEENIQARCRGLLLMGISNKFGSMLLTTGNKSEMAVGFATLYGDMAGGFAPLKDCTKTLVYRLSRYRNGIAAVIPERVLTRPPSAELGPDQKDSDSLPPYDVLDPILEAFIERDLSVEEIAALGFERETVGRVLGMVKRAEYKRRQAPPGVRVSNRAFGRDWRYPITSGY
jgi:NAD+ synthase (glutamine-hydrolysing)